MKEILKNYNLSLVLLVLFLVSWAAQGNFQWQEFVNHQKQEQQEVKVEEFIPEFLSATFENWQSEFLQLLSMVVLTSFLIHKGSAESKDSTDEMMAAIQRIEKTVNKSKK